MPQNSISVTTGLSLESTNGEGLYAVFPFTAQDTNDGKHPDSNLLDIVPKLYIRAGEDDISVGYVNVQEGGKVVISTCSAPRSGVAIGTDNAAAVLKWAGIDKEVPRTATWKGGETPSILFLLSALLPTPIMPALPDLV
jgi:hypothetical protein